MARLVSTAAAALLLLSAGSAPHAAAQGAGGADNEAVAIIPFANISGTEDDAWYGAGIAETLAASLQGAGVTIVYGEAPAGADDAAAGRALGAAWVIGGSYQRQGGRLRITARVVDTATGSVMRTSILDGAVAELFALQDRLAADLRPALPAERRAAPPQAAAGAPGVAAPPPPARPAAPPAGVRPPAAPSAPRREERPAAATAPLATGLAMAPRILIDGPPPPVAPATVARNAAGAVTMRATRLAQPLRLDGALDEGFYEVVPPIEGFLQQMPIEGAAATERTEAWVFFDDENLYVSARLWDSAPEERWVANEMQRDSFQLIQNEYFGIALDTFYDRRNGFGFLISPLGGFADYQITDEGNPNIDWNPIWDSRAGRFDGGWTVETQIPFQSLRFRPGLAEQVWGIQLSRNIRWKNEVVHSTPVPISGGPGEFRLSAAATLTGVQVPSGNRTFEIKPYAIGGLATDVASGIRNDGTGDAGIDVKFGVTENLTADFTYNTDFAQVEVDEQQVNLTRFSLFFPEKRDFFLESRGIFDFAGGAIFGGGGGPSAARPTGGGAAAGGGGFFGGGDAPTIFFSRRIGLESEGGLSRTVPILGGGRLTGRIGPFSIGALTIQTDRQDEVGALPTNFSVLRISRDILRRSRIGAIITRRSVSTRGPGANEVYGVDGQFAFYDNLYVNGYYARSRTAGLEGDDDSYQGVVTYNGDLFAFQVDQLRVGDNFSPEIGFMRRWNFRRTFATADYRPRPRSIESVRQFTFGAALDYVETGSGAVESRIAQGRFQTEFENSDMVGFDVQRSYEMVATPFDLAPEVTIPVGSYDFQDFYASYTMGTQRRVAGSFTFQRGGFYHGNITAVGFQQTRVELTPQLSFQPGLSINHIELPLLGAATIPLFTSRVTYTLTPRMFFGGLVQYNSTNASLGTNLRLRWEYQPGSELFVVYNDTRDTSIRGRAPFLQNRAFIVKLTRLFRF